MMKKALTRLLSASGLVLVACGSPGLDEGRLLPADDVTYNTTAEEKRLQEMQYFHVVGSDGKTETWDLRGFTPSIQPPSCSLTIIDPENIGCRLQQRLQSLDSWLPILEGATSTAALPAYSVRDDDVVVSPLAWSDVPASSNYIGNLEYLTIPPQSTHTKAKLAEVLTDGDNPYYSSGALFSQLANANFLGRSQIAPLAGEVLDRIERLAEVRAQLIIAAADAQFGSSSQASLSLARTWSGSSLSRSAAAHSLIGGPDGIEGKTGVPLCKSGMSAAGHRAVQLIRSLAPSPSSLKSVEAGSITLNDFVNKVDAVDGIQSLRERFQSANGTVVASLEGETGLLLTDFAEAVEYLVQEVELYDLPDVVLSKPIGQGTNTYPAYAATANGPGDLPPQFWTAVTRSPGPVNNTSSPALAAFSGPTINSLTNNPGDGVWGPRRSASDTITSLLYRISQYVRSDPADPALEAYPVLASLLASSDHLGFFEHKVYGDGDAYRLMLLRPDNRRFFLAKGDDALRCAVMGNKYGTKCSSFVKQDSAGNVHTSNVGLSNGEIIEFERDSIPKGAYADTLFTNGHGQDGNHRMYLLVQRGTLPARPTDLMDVTEDPWAGRFEAVMGFVPSRVSPYSSSTSQVTVNYYGIVPKWERLAGEIMARSPEDCSRPVIKCAAGEFDGTGVFDERIPLENELSEDGDGVENSWKHYLIQARAAATESDALTREYIDASEGNDLRAESVDEKRRAQMEKAEQELERLQSICGTSVGISTLLSALATTDDSDINDDGIPDSPSVIGSFRNRPCSSSTGLDPGELCINGRVVVLWEAVLASNARTAELLKLQQCIQDFTEVVDKVHFSTSDMCIWETDLGVCLPNDRPAGASTSCPIPKPIQGCPANMESLSKDSSLQIFDFRNFSAVDLNEDEDGSICELVRLTRAGMSNSALLSPTDRIVAQGQIVMSGLYNVSSLRDIRSVITVEAKYGGYVDVKVGGRIWVSTGSISDGPNFGAWPCEAKPSDPEGEKPLPDDCADLNPSENVFGCKRYDCSDPEDRARANDRLIDAFKALAEVSLDQYNFNKPTESGAMEFWLPVYLRRFAYPTDYVLREMLVPDGQGGDAIIGEKVNETWKSYWHLDSVPNQVAYIRHGETMFIDGIWDGYLTSPISEMYLSGPVKYKIGFHKVDGPTYKLPLFKQVFGGLEDTRSAPGYFVGRLNGFSHADEVLRAFGRSDYIVNWDKYEPIRSDTFCDNKTPENAETLQLGGGALTADWFGWAKAESEDTNEICADQNSLAYYTPSQDGEYSDFHVPSLASGEEQLLDAFELVCEATLKARGKVSCATPPSVSSVDDLANMASYLDCQAGTISEKMAGTILRQVPQVVLDDLMVNSPASESPGEMGAAVSELREAMTDIVTSGNEVSRIFRGFAIEMRQIKSRVRIQSLKDKLSSLHFSSVLSDRITSCAEAVSEASGWSKNIGTYGSHWVGVAAVCANSAIQTTLASKILAVEQQISSEERSIIFGDGETEFLRLEKAIADEAVRLTVSAERMQRALGRIEALRDEARRSIDHALWHLSFQSEKAVVINNVMKSEAATAHTRYIRAHTNAKHWAFLARRAIEQRLGVDLSSVLEDLPLVEAPQRWVDSVCATSPVKYEELGRTTGDYADSFIGGYVTKLENLVESYRLTYGFQDGADTAVVSLRDDVFNSRQGCEVDSKSLLLHAADFGIATPVAQTQLGKWQLVDCPTPTDSGQNSLGLDSLCITATESDSPFLRPNGSEEQVPSYEIQFGDGESETCPGTSVSGPDGSIQVYGECDVRSGSRLTQAVELDAGTYRYSWYAPPSLTGLTGIGQHVGGIWDEDGTLLAGMGTVQSVPGVVADGQVITWDRHFVEFDVERFGVYSVGFSRPSGGDYDSLDYMKYEVGAPMLERVNTSANADRKPTPFSNTGDTLTEMRYACEDRDGTEFRKTWTRACERVCPAGSGSICPSTAIEQCYWENSFYIDQRSIASGRILNASGFARGNFNYRIEGIALNFVGTGIRACEQSETASACFGGGFVPYSLYHTGPFMVHNHFGYDYEAKLFDGVIEHARGLGAERYISNPIGTEDKEMLIDYTRSEYRGRPLDGGFTIRVWEEDGIDFSAIEDVQVIMNYRYWSR